MTLRLIGRASTLFPNENNTTNYLYNIIREYVV